MTITKYKVVCTCVLAFIIGFFSGYTTFVAKEAQAKGATLPKPIYKTYRVDFNNKKCEFCGCNPAEFYEFSSCKSTNTTTAEYLCAGCREVVRYK